MSRIPSPPGWYRFALAGAALGLGWGVAARAWMRYVSDRPEFTWSGTGSILVLCTVTGVSFGTVEWARRSGRSRWWRVSAVPSILLLAGPGLVMAPPVLLGALAVSGRGRSALRLAAGLLALVSALGLPALVPVPRSLTVTLVGYLLLLAAEALAFSTLLRRRASAPTVMTTTEPERVTLRRAS